MRKAILAVVAAAAMLIGAAPAAAQTVAPPASGDSEIVVRGERDLARQIEAFVGALTPAPVRGQLGRVELAACPVALGFVPAQRAAIEQRLRAVAREVGMEVGQPGCATNMLVIATDNKRTFLETLRRRHRSFLDGMSSAAFRRLLDQPGPSAAWHVEGQVDADGVPLMNSMDAGVPENRRFGNASRITNMARPYIQAAALVVEVGALDGLSTTQLADYAAMRLFARTDPSRLPQPAPETILTILEAPMGTEVPLTLTRWDLGFLRGLYGSTNNIYAPGQRGEIARGIARELQQAEPPRR